MARWQIQGNKFDFSIEHTIAAPEELVYEVLAAMEAYPEFINDLVSVQREGELYRFVARAALLTIPATVAVTKTPGRAIRFELVDGPVDHLSGAWLIEPGAAPGQTRVSLTIHAETDGRGEWLLRMTGRYMENKTTKLIAAFSQRVEQLQQGGRLPSPPAGGLLSRLKRWWARYRGRLAAAPVAPLLTGAKPAGLFRDEHFAQTLEALAAALLPPDDFDEGVAGLGFVSVAEMRARYEAGREEMYRTALAAIDQQARAMFDRPAFIDLAPVERMALLEAVRQNQVNGEAWGQVKPAGFFSALWEDVVFLYCTHPDTWQRIGFPGPSFEPNGYPDFAQPQMFLGIEADVRGDA